MEHMSQYAAKWKLAQFFLNYKIKQTLNVQAACNFWQVHWWPGGKEIKILLPGRDTVPLFLLADPAYPLLSHCMKQYSTCYTNERVIFNHMLRNERNKVECAYERLKPDGKYSSKRSQNYNLLFYFPFNTNNV